MPAFFILLFNTGLAVGPIIAGKVSDRFGRVRVIAAGAVAVVLLNLILTFNTFGGAWGYAIMRMLAICVALILALPAMVYPTEVLTPKYRSICGLIVVSTALGAGILLVILFAVFIRDWRTLQLIVSFISLPSIGTFYDNSDIIYGSYDMVVLHTISGISFGILYGPYSMVLFNMKPIKPRHLFYQNPTDGCTQRYVS